VLALSTIPQSSPLGIWAAMGFGNNSAINTHGGKLCETVDVIRIIYSTEQS
jgi:hypothetical protein